MSSKIDQVRFWLEDKGYITTWDAIQTFGATRLSAIIFNLRHEGYEIENDWQEAIDRNGNKIRYVKYVLKGIPKDRKMIKENENHIPSVE